MNLIKPVKCLTLSLSFIVFIPSSIFALSSDAKLPFHFHSVSITYNKYTHQTTYLGNVHITQGTTRISGNEVVIQYGSDGTVKKLIDTGNPAHYSTLTDNRPGRLYATAKKIIYNPKTRIVLMEGNGRVTQEKNVFSGPHIWYYMDAGVVRTTPQKNQETKIVIQPQEY